MDCILARLLTFFVCLVLFSIVQPCVSDDPTQALIRQICRQTPDFYFCSDVFHQHLPSPTTNAVGLTQIAITQSLINSTQNRIFIQKGEAAEKDQQKKGLFEVCNVCYGAVMESFENANFAFARQDYKGLLFYVSKTDRPVSDCENVLGASVMGLSERNRQMKILISMSLVSGNLIVSQPHN